MVKHTQTIRRQLPTNCLSVFDHFANLALKGLKNEITRAQFLPIPQIAEPNAVQLKKNNSQIIWNLTEIVKQINDKSQT